MGHRGVRPMNVIRVKDNSPESISRTLCKALSILKEQGFSGGWYVEGSMKDGGVGSAELTLKPVKQNLLGKKSGGNR